MTMTTTVTKPIYNLVSIRNDDMSFYFKLVVVGYEITSTDLVTMEK